MGRICAWCGTVLDAAISPRMPVSHVLCPSCLADLAASLTGRRMRLDRPQDRH